jgi:hypothetical protein
MANSTSILLHPVVRIEVLHPEMIVVRLIGRAKLVYASNGSFPRSMTKLFAACVVALGLLTSGAQVQADDLADSTAATTVREVAFALPTVAHESVVDAARADVRPGVAKTRRLRADLQPPSVAAGFLFDPPARVVAPSSGICAVYSTPPTVLRL